MTRKGQKLSTLIDISGRLQEVRKMQLCIGDTLFVKTCNSVYAIRVEAEGWFSISGGWFDRNGSSPVRVRISGCTWGGSVIKVDVVAASGLCLEFSNRVVTSPIQKIVYLPYGTQN